MDNFPHLPTMLFVAGAVVALVFILNKWLFGPLNEILARRQSEIDAAKSAFDEAQKLQAERLEAVEARVAESRREAFAIREKAQGEARAHREQVIGEARDDAAREIETARAEISQQIDDARAQLDADADELARKIAEQILGRPVEADGGKE
jgi:F-type H+-transporting ATPase subunit b